MILLALLVAEWTAPARELARKVPAVEIVLTVRNLSGLDAPAFAEARRRVEEEVTARGAKLQPQPPAPNATIVDVRVTLAESLRALVWTAEIRTGDHIQTAIVNGEWPAKLAADRVTITKRLVWEQERPMLDVLDTGSSLVVLEPSQMVIYRGGEAASVVAFPESGPVKRDARGRIILQGDSFVAYAWGIVCRSSACSSSNEAWPFATGPNRQGSDSALIESSCGRYIVSSRPTRADEPDALDLYDAGQAPQGEAEEFPGPITALWSNGPRATAIVRNLRTGRYAAFAVSLDCRR